MEQCNFIHNYTFVKIYSSTMKYYNFLSVLFCFEFELEYLLKVFFKFILNMVWPPMANV